MSAAVISSLVRCDELDRKHEKKDKTPQKRRRGTESTWHTQCNVNFPAVEKVNENTVHGKYHLWMERLLFIVCRVSNAWTTSLKILAILKPAGNVPSQMLPLEKRTRGVEQKGWKLGYR